MSTANPAVFLSYASQDAEAAARIATALRSIGVEVWFDVEGGLEQGDEWDAKIRHQIKDCVLFIAVVSANTEARHEGYFRLEWDLAAERARGIASGVPFLLPVVIDDTSEQTALVPDRFKAVQWTKLPAGEVSDKVQARFLKLWSQRTGSVGAAEPPGVGSGIPTSPNPSAPLHSPTAKRRMPLWIFAAAAVILIGVAAAIWSTRQPDVSIAAATPAVDAATTEFDRIMAQAWVLIYERGMSRPSLEAADQLCAQAVALEPGNPVVWAAWAHTHSWFIFHRFDDSTERRKAAQDCADRAMRLNPTGFEPRFAQAMYWFRSRTANAVQRSEAGAVLRDLQNQDPSDLRVRYILGAYLFWQADTRDEGQRMLESITTNAPLMAVAQMEIGWGYYFVGEFPVAERAIDRAISALPYWNNITLRIRLALQWHGDLELASEWLQKIPADEMQDDFCVYHEYFVHAWRRQTQPAIDRLSTHPRAWMESNPYEGPRTYLLGLARLAAGQTTAAANEFRQALAVTEQRLQRTPNDPDLLAFKALCLSYLNRREEAREAYTLFNELTSYPAIHLTSFFDVEKAIDQLELMFESGNWQATAATLRLNPDYDRLRDHPRFQALLARAEASPKHTPNPIVADSDSDLSSASKSDLPTTHYPLLSAEVPQSGTKAEPATAGATAPAKSIAVLPFANRSANADDAYFTDGIHDDLLTHISRIKELRTTSRTSVMTYRDTRKSMPEIGQELRVAHILEGGVQRAGNQIRINVQLIDAAKDEHVWAEIYTREMTAENVFAIQSEIATDIAAQLQAVLSPEEQERLSRLPTDNLAALEAYFQGKQAWDEASVEGFEAGSAHFQRAVELDPNFADAHAALATSYLALIWHAGLPPAEQITKAEPHVMKALKLDPHSSAAHIALSQLHGYSGRNAEADQSLRRAIELDPNNVEAYANLAGRLVYRKFDRLEEAIALADRALELDPQFHHARANKATALAQLGRKEESRRERQYIIADMGANAGQSLRALADLEAYHFNRYDEAIKSARLAYQLDSRSPASALLLAWLYDELDMPEESVAWWQRAIDLSPAGQETDFYRWQLTLTQGDRQEGRRQAEALLTEKPDYWTADLARVWLYWENYHEGRYDHVIDQIEGRYPELADADPEVIEENFRLVCAYNAALVKAGREDHALKVEQIWEEVTRDFPLFGHFGVGSFRSWMKLTVGDREAAKTLLMAGRKAGGVFDFSRGKFFSQDIHAAFQDDPDYQAMLKDMQAELAAQRANVEHMEAAGELTPMPPLPEETL